MTRTSDQIDPHIADLVCAMNESGLVKTIASCQGHPYKLSDPYVYFAASEAIATRIESALREWTRGPEKCLGARWQLIGLFNSECQLRFRLMAWEYVDTSSSFWRWPIIFFKKRQIQRDFKLLAELFRQVFPPSTTGGQ